MGTAGSLSRQRTFQSPSRLGLAVALCVAMLAGCGKKDRIVGPDPPPTYPRLTSPQQVLVALKMAYVAKDTIEYKLLFDQAYLGTSTVQTSPGPVDSFTFADEARHIAALAYTRAIVELQLTPTMTRSSDSTDPPGWALIQHPVQSLTVYDGPNLYTIDPSRETIEFSFIPTLDSTSPTDTTWKIIRWSEIAQ